MKICFKCGLKKDLSAFYKHPQMPDGHVNKCKECNKKDVKNNYNANVIKPGFIEKERKRGRKKYHRLYIGLGKSNKKTLNNWKEKYPEKVSANIKSQRIKKDFYNAERHHWSYNEKHCKDVIQLTKKDHMKAHRFLIYDQEQMMYRRFDTLVLLDTKERHELFIKDCIENRED